MQPAESIFAVCMYVVIRADHFVLRNHLGWLYLGQANPPSVSSQLPIVTCPGVTLLDLSPSVLVSLLILLLFRYFFYVAIFMIDCFTADSLVFLTLIIFPFPLLQCSLSHRWWRDIDVSVGG